MIETHVYRCGKGCLRESAAELESIGSTCCTHGAQYMKVGGSQASYPAAPPSDIRARREEVEARRRRIAAAETMIAAELKGLQQECPHPRLRKWRSHDYGGGSDAHEACDDCGLTRMR